MVSPITGNSNVTVIQKYLAADLILKWKKAFELDISDELKSVKEIFLCECNESKLRFYLPIEVAGSDKLYKKLSEKYEWYYGEEKWEFDIGADLVQKFSPRSLLEVGSGKGHFLRKIIPSVENALGIEFNQDALVYAKKEKLPIKNLTLGKLIESSSSFDFIASFEVFEHLTEPLTFIQDSLRLLSQNGRMLIAVPNRNSFVKYGEVLLDMPPHHMLTINVDFFKYLANRFNLELEIVKYEPLASYHIDFYLSLLREKIFNNFHSFTVRRGFSLILKIYRKLLSFGFIRSFVRGQTILVVLRKR